MTTDNRKNDPTEAQVEEDDKGELVKKIFTVLGVIAALILVGAPSAQAANPPAYQVTAEGIKLPGSNVFQDNGHINVRYSLLTGEVKTKNVHFEGKCVNRTDAECAGTRHEVAQFIGKGEIPWSAFGLSDGFCVEWTQVSHSNTLINNYHFGQQGEKAMCIPPVDPCVDDPYKQGCEVPPQPEPWLSEQARENYPVCTDALDGTATVTTEKAEGIQEFTWNPETWEWVLPLDITWGEWYVIDTKTVELATCIPIPATGGALTPVTLGVTAVLLITGAGVLVLAQRRKVAVE